MEITRESMNDPVPVEIEGDRWNWYYVWLLSWSGRLER